MKKQLRLAFQKGDLLAVLLVVVLAVGTVVGYAGMSNRTEQLIVQIYHDGRLVRELPLDSEETIQIDDQYSNTVSVSNGRAAIVESDCPGEDCVHSGWIDGAGRSIVCLPNRVEIRIVGVSDVDFVVG